MTGLKSPHGTCIIKITRLHLNFSTHFLMEVSVRMKKSLTFQPDGKMCSMCCTLYSGSTLIWTREILAVGICAKHAVSCWAPNERFRQDLLGSSEILSSVRKKCPLMMHFKHSGNYHEWAFKLLQHISGLLLMLTFNIHWVISEPLKGRTVGRD